MDYGSRVAKKWGKSALISMNEENSTKWSGFYGHLQSMLSSNEIFVWHDYAAKSERSS